MSLQIQRLPALPLIVNDPFFSIWCPGDRLTDVDTAHWSGARKPLTGTIAIDGTQYYRWLGAYESLPAMPTVALDVTPTRTSSVFEADGVRLEARFTSPLLLDNPDVLSMPATYIDFSARSIDGAAHEISLAFELPYSLCYNSETAPAMMHDAYTTNGLQIAYAGQREQHVLAQSGDLITIDWGYLYLAGASGIEVGDAGLKAGFSGRVDRANAISYSVIAAYDEIASINYFGKLCPPYYARNGKTIVEAICELHASRAGIMAECDSLDAQLLADATAKGGEDYALIISASYRHSIAAHKLIADENGDMIFLSKENNSNGCIGTVDISYPSSPLFLLYNAEFVKAMCRPVLRFARLPVWTYDFAPHDVGRYPYATGQVYGSTVRSEYRENGCVYPPLYMYPADAALYEHKYQMPVEECGNMLIMLAAALHADGDTSLVRESLPILTQWVDYLTRYGDDPGDQLCTDDFAGHLAHNINLSAKAVCGIAAYGLILRALGDASGADWLAKARELAASWKHRAFNGEHSYLTFDGRGWSMKYNLIWDKLFKLHLLESDFYTLETESYIPRQNEYGLPLDSRADYTKSDWIAWTAALTEDNATFRKLIAPVAHYLRQTTTRVPFSDWYDSKTGKYVAFIARSVQGGMFMPLLADKWW